VEFESQIEGLIGRFINPDLFRFVESLDPENEVSLLNRERSIQTKRLSEQQQELKEKGEKMIFLGATAVTATLFAVVIVILYRGQRRSRLILLEQKAEIEAQSDYIKAMNESLEAKVQSRTFELQQKNKALREYAFITAHKLRAPLSGILGLVGLMDSMKLPEQEKILVTHLKTASEKLDGIVHEVMRSVETGDDVEKETEKKKEGDE
ncbi:MAG: hypothetical protein ACKOE6_16960, partial [Flammeovirgaceae bacterium]